MAQVLFGEKLKEARKEAGLSQEQFAEKMCVSRSAIAKWETDKAEWIVDFVVQPGVVEVLDRFKELAGYYLVERGNKQYFVKVTNEFIVTNELTERVDVRKFELGNHRYKKGYRIV